MASPPSESLLYILFAAAVVVSVAESITEPAVYDMAVLFPSSLTSQSVQSGAGACGMVVSCMRILTRLGTNGFGDIGKEQLEKLSYVFIVVMGASGICLSLVYTCKI